MNCSQPPPLTDDQLSAAIDGDAGLAVLAHLAACPACAARLEAVRRLEESLGSRLHRWDCPPPQQLADYHVGLVAQDAAQVIAGHLAQCVLCASEIAELRAFLATDAVAAPVDRSAPPQARPRLGEVFARLLPRPPALALRGAAVRPIGAEAPGVAIMLETRSSGPTEVLLNGQVLAEDHERWVGALVELRQGGHLRATAEVDDLGTFACNSLRAAPTELRLTPRTGAVVVVPEVDLAE